MKSRRDRLRAGLGEIGADALLVTKPENVRYLTGFSGSNAQLLVGRDQDVFLTDPRYEEQSSHECADLRREIYSTSSGSVGESGGMWGTLAAIVAELSIERFGVEAQHVTLDVAATMRERLAGVSLVEVKGEVETLRRVKDAAEIEMIRRACAIGDQALQALLGRLAAGQTEVEVAVLLEHEMRRAGSQGISFDSIVAFGEQAAEPHHHPTKRTLRSGDLIKLDFGATWRGYHSDMTRTIAFGEPSAEMREIYELVRGSQQAGLDAVRAGATTGDVDTASRAYLEARGHGFGHGTGHGVGLEVHEAPAVRAGGTDVLEVGTVITVEPGIYLPRTGGVRIEDTVAVTSNGCDILTSSPKELVKVQA